MTRTLPLGLVGSLLLAASAAAQPSDAERKPLETGIEALAKRITSNAWASQPTENVTDVEVCVTAVERALRHGELKTPDDLKRVSSVLSLGQARADAIEKGPVDRRGAPGGFVFGYRSEVDGTVQPYALTFPDGYDGSAAKRWPLYVVLHGRNDDLTQAKFVMQFQGKKPPGKRDYVQLDVFGRGNNAYRWAGETDVFEALADARRRLKVDDRRIVLWGFSMGGAGAWHLGLHHPDRWAAAGAGAGFVDFYGYQNRKEKLPPHQDATLAVYDAVPYALNAANVPFVTYGGEQDKQLLASTTMLEAAKESGVEIAFVLGKAVGHKFTPEGEKEFQAFLAKHAAAGRPLPTARKKIRFTTLTPKYDRCGWVAVAEMAELYTPAIVEAEIADDGDLARVTTLNVVALRLDRDAADEAEIDGVRLPLRDAADGLLPEVVYVRQGDGWRALGYDESRTFQANPDRRKRHGLQGPIDDAFMSAFVCVTGDGTPWHATHQDYARWSLGRFEREFDRYMHGRVPTVAADEVTDETIAEKNLVLFGDPGSNPLIAKVLPDLPVQWTKDRLVVGGRTFDPATHAVVLIYPNPLNPQRYVVLNTGHTFHEDALKGTNAALYPRLGDAAVLKVAADGKGGFTEETAWAGLFGTDWQLAE